MYNATGAVLRDALAASQLIEIELGDRRDIPASARTSPMASRTPTMKRASPKPLQEQEQEQEQEVERAEENTAPAQDAASAAVTATEVPSPAVAAAGSGEVRTARLRKEPGARLGLAIRTQEGSGTHPLIPTVIADSLAHRDGTIRPGDELVSVRLPALSACLHLRLFVCGLSLLFFELQHILCVCMLFILHALHGFDCKLTPSPPFFHFVTLCVCVCLRVCV